MYNCRHAPDLATAASSTPSSPRHKHARHEEMSESSAAAKQAPGRLAERSTSGIFSGLPAKGGRQQASAQSSPNPSSSPAAAAEPVAQVTHPLA